MPSRVLQSTGLMDLNDVGDFAKFSSIQMDDRGWLDVSEYKVATVQIEPESSATTADVIVRYSIDRINELPFASGDTISLNAANALTIDVSDVPYIRVQTGTAEGSALKARAWLFLANLDVTNGGR